MKKLILLSLICVLFFTSCSVSDKTRSQSIDKGALPLSDIETTFDSTDYCMSGSSYYDILLDTTITTINDTRVILPLLPSEELNTSLQTQLEEYLASLDLLFYPKTLDFVCNEGLNTRSFIFYIADSSELHNLDKFIFSYNTTTLKEPVLSDYIEKEILKEILVDYCGSNVKINDFSVLPAGIMLYTDNGEISIPEDRFVDDGTIFVFHPQAYQPVTDTSEKYVAITFDDGPNPNTTLPLLEMLAEKNVKATFFMVGYNVEEFPSTVKKVYNAGHDIGIHSYAHSNYGLMNPENVLKDIDKCSDLLYSIIGRHPYLVRPPFGNIKISQIKTDKYFFVNWNVDPLDWQSDSAEEIARAAISHTQPGSIILLHDIYKASCDAAEIIIDTLLEKGYRFVTLSEYFDLNGKKVDNKLHFFLEDYNVEEN